MDIDNFVLSLPTLIMTSMNQKFQLLNRGWSGNIFVSRNSLDSISSNRFQYYFNVYLKCKDAQAFGFCSNSGRKTKAFVEQIILQIQPNSQSKVASKNEILETVDMSKMYLLQKSLASFLVNTPLFSYLLQNHFAEIQPADFEAVCSSKQEEKNMSFMEHTWLKNLRIGDYTISIGLYTIPSHAVTDLIKEYIGSTDVSPNDIENLLDKSGADSEGGRDINKSWDLLPEEFPIESHKNQRKESLDSTDEDTKPRSFSMQKPLVSQKMIEVAAGEKKEDSLKEKFRKKKYTNSTRDEDEEFIDVLFEYTKKLKMSSAEKFKESVEGVNDRMDRETYFCNILKSMK